MMADALFDASTSAVISVYEKPDWITRNGSTDARPPWQASTQIWPPIRTNGNLFGKREAFLLMNPSFPAQRAGKPASATRAVAAHATLKAPYYMPTRNTCAPSASQTQKRPRAQCRRALWGSAVERGRASLPSCRGSCSRRRCRRWRRAPCPGRSRRRP